MKSSHKSPGAKTVYKTQYKSDWQDATFEAMPIV